MLEAPNGDPEMTRAPQGPRPRVQRVGLAREVKRNVLILELDWRDRLQAIELHLDVRKRLMQERVMQLGVEQSKALKNITRELLGR
jgi:hypothetical protein